MGDKKVNLTNFQMEEYVNNLESFLDRNDIIGYAAARNTRILTEASSDYGRIKMQLLRKYGSPVKDEHGNDTDQIKITSDDEHFYEVAEQINLSGNISHEVTIYTISPNVVASELTGREILLIDWMLDEEG